MRVRLASLLITGVTCVGQAQLASPAVATGSPSYLVDSALLSNSPSPARGQAQSAAGALPVHQQTRSNDDEDRAESEWTGFKSSSYVPLDSWIYPAFDRLEALGYIETSFTSVRPWTRLECARILAEAYAFPGLDKDDESILHLLHALDVEFARETNVIDGEHNIGAQAESAYTRISGIAGTPIRDGYHFGQTLVDDYGRPFGQGVNAITGVAGRAQAGPLSFYLRGEYQYASTIPAYSAAAQQTIAAYDGLPFGWNLRLGNTNRIRPIEAYVALNLSNWQITFGQQSLWWGPDRTTSLILSNNAAPMPMLRLARVRPIRLPGPLSHVGLLHFEFFFSRQGGVHYVGLGPNFTIYGTPSQALTPPPYMWGGAFTVKPTPNLELGLTHTVIFAGYGRPLNLHTFLHTFSLYGNAQAVDPGKRVTEFNFAYHLPGLRKVLLYNEAMAWDDPIQGKFVARFAMAPGVYLSQVPGLKKLDLRAEGAYTNLPKLPYQAYFYANAHYPQGYTNYGQILGSWVGRQGAGGQATSTWWLSERNKASVTYRRMVSDKSFLQGGNMTDLSGNLTWLLRPDVELSAMGQYERWSFPLITAAPKHDFTTSFEVRFYPKQRAGSK